MFCLPPKLGHLAGGPGSLSENVTKALINFIIFRILRWDVGLGRSLAGGLRCEVEASEGSTAQVFKAVLQDFPANFGIGRHGLRLVGLTKGELLEHLGFQLFRERHVLHDGVLSVGLFEKKCLDCGFLWTLFLHTKGDGQELKILFLTC